MKDTSVNPMTTSDFDELGIVNYASGITDSGIRFIQIIKCKNNPKLNAFPILDDVDAFEISEELYQKLESMAMEELNNT